MNDDYKHDKNLVKLINKFRSSPSYRGSNPLTFNFLSNILKEINGGLDLKTKLEYYFESYNKDEINEKKLCNYLLESELELIDLTNGCLQLSDEDYKAFFMTLPGSIIDFNKKKSFFEYIKKMKFISDENILNKMEDSLEVNHHSNHQKIMPYKFSLFN